MRSLSLQVPRSSLQGLRCFFHPFLTIPASLSDPIPLCDPVLSFMDLYLLFCHSSTPGTPVPLLSPFPAAPTLLADHAFLPP